MPARSVEQVRNLCKRRGFVFPGSAAYGGLGSFWDYGPLGVEMLNNIKQAWWRDSVYKRDDMEGLDAAILMSRKVWQHSGHEATFSDPLLDNKRNGKRYRLDQLLEQQQPEVRANLYESTGTSDLASLLHFMLGKPDTVPMLMHTARVTDPASGEVGEWTEPRRFNLMFKTHVGPVETFDEGQELASRVYLRPETAQGIFMNFAHVQRSLARKVPFGIAQIGKAFRNEITPGNFIFRTREFEQMEIEFFIKPPQFTREGEKTDDQWHEEWIKQRYEWWLSLGIDESRLRKREQAADELAHYSKRTVDLEYLFPEFGWGEIEGVANRTDYDLTAHSKDVPEDDLKRLKLEPNTDSVEKFDYFDPDAKARYIPWVIEPSAGATRAMLAFLCEAYDEELVKEPPQAEVDAIAAEIPAVIKNAQKKAKVADRESGSGKRESEDGEAIPDSRSSIPAKHDAAAISDFCEKLEEAAKRLPQSLLEIDALLAEHPGAQNLEPVKKLKPKVNKLAEDCARVVLRLKPELAPIKLAVFPLKKNKPELVDIARRLKQTFQQHFRTVYDDSAGIGRLYRRQDEIGTPWCITVDFQTLEDNTVTVRERDSMQQTRVSIEELRDYFTQRMHG
jgi:glycyl-tRNA synthetase